MMNLETLQRELEQIQRRIAFAQQVERILSQNKNSPTLQDFLRACLQVEPAGAIDICQVAECFGFEGWDNIKLAIFAAVSEGWAHFDHSWRFAALKPDAKGD